PRCARRVRGAALSRFAQNVRLVEQRAEALRLEQAATRSMSELELVEDLLRGGVALLRAPLPPEPLHELAVALMRIEDAPDDELRCHGSVPAVLLQPEGDVEAAEATQPIKMRAEPEGNRAAGIEPIL